MGRQFGFAVFFQAFYIKDSVDFNGEQISNFLLNLFKNSTFISNKSISGFLGLEYYSSFYDQLYNYELIERKIFYTRSSNYNETEKELIIGDIPKEAEGDKNHAICELA